MNVWEIARFSHIIFTFFSIFVAHYMRFYHHFHTHIHTQANHNHISDDVYLETIFRFFVIIIITVIIIIVYTIFFSSLLFLHTHIRRNKS